MYCISGEDSEAEAQRAKEESERQEKAEKERKEREKKEVKNTDNKDAPVLRIGSKIRLIHNFTGARLHSHSIKYHKGSRQQQGKISFLWNGIWSNYNAF